MTPHMSGLSMSVALAAVVSASRLGLPFFGCCWAVCFPACYALSYRPAGAGWGLCWWCHLLSCFLPTPCGHRQ